MLASEVRLIRGSGSGEEGDCGGAESWRDWNRWIWASWLTDGEDLRR